MDNDYRLAIYLKDISKMSNIINNLYQPSLELAFKIADELGLDIKKVFIYTKDSQK